MKKNFACFHILLFILILFQFFACDNNSLSSESNNSDVNNTKPGNLSPVTPESSYEYYNVVFYENNGNSINQNYKQIFTSGIPQKLKTIVELGFSNDGKVFAGWGLESNDSQTTYLDGDIVSITSNIELYAVWFAVPVYSVNIIPSIGGNITTSSVTGVEGDLIELYISPEIGYEIDSFEVKDSENTSIVVVENENNRTFIMPSKNVSITARFKEMNIGQYTVLPPGTDGTIGSSGSYVTFGTWPQTRKENDIIINEDENKVAGMFIYYKGSDNCWYAKNNDNYYKVEPIKWRIITNNYNGCKLLLAEKILYKCSFIDDCESNRIINGKRVYPNNYEHSKVRAFLNGLNYCCYTRQVDSTFQNKGFLQTAFSVDEQNKIMNTQVDNSLYSYWRYSTSNQPSSVLTKIKSVACNNTEDKIFLLSICEAIEYNFRTNTETKCFTTTAFAGGANNHGLLRSPYIDSSTKETQIGFYIYWFNIEGNTSYLPYHTSLGIVPAICVEN